MHFSIRRAVASDFAHILEIIKSLPEYFTEGALPDIEADLNDPGVSTIVAESDSRISGFLSFRVKSGEMSAELAWLAVDPRYHTQGVGRALMEKFLADMKLQNIKIIELATIASTVHFQPYEKTRKFYEKFGFREAQIDKDYYALGDDRAIMRLELSD